MKFTAYYNPRKDIAMPDQFGFSDLCKAHANGVIAPQDMAKELDHNGIEDPRSLIGRPKDTFERLQQAKAVSGYTTPQKAGENAPTPAAGGNTPPLANQ